MHLKQNGRGNLALEVYSILKKQIITLEFKPGELLSERDLIEKLGVGRTPLREAIILLKSENLLDCRPNEAPYVKDITLKGVKDFFVPFLAVEKLVMSLAAQKMTPRLLNEIKSIDEEIDRAIKKRDNWNIMARNRELHSLIASASDNEHAIFIYEALSNQKERLSYLAISSELQNDIPLQEHLETLSKQHKEIIYMLGKNDFQEAEHLAEAHVKLFQHRISYYLTQM